MCGIYKGGRIMSFYMDPGPKAGMREDEAAMRGENC